MQRVVSCLGVVGMRSWSGETNIDRAHTTDLIQSRGRWAMSECRSLKVIYRTCAIVECEVIFDQWNVDHIEYLEIGGSTELNNVIPLC